MPRITTRDRWTDAELKAMLGAWKNSPPDMNMFAFAQEYAKGGERSASSILWKLREQPEAWVADSPYQPWNNPPLVEGDALILMDAHIPYHDAGFINKCLRLSTDLGIETLIMGGDALDFHAFNGFPQDFERDDKRVMDRKTARDLAEIAESLPAEKREQLYDTISKTEPEGGASAEFKEARAALRAMAQTFRRVIWMMGNHEQRATRLLERVLDSVTLAAVFGTEGRQWTVSPYYWCKLHSGTEDWQIEHPVNSGKHSSKKLAPKFQCNIVMGHNHHFSVTTDPSGRYLAIEPGMVADERLMGYAMQRHNAADQHVLGALAVRGGKPILLNRWTDWEAYKPR